MDVSTEIFDDTMKTNLYAMFWITKAALPHMEEGASIINVASMVAEDPPKILLEYNMTKAAIVNFSKTLSKQVAERGIRVNSISPGPFWTPLQPSGGQPQEEVARFGEDSLMGRPGQPVEIAGVFVLLASQESSFATGQDYAATGGA